MANWYGSAFATPLTDCVIAMAAAWAGAEPWRLFLFDLSKDQYDDPSSRDLLDAHRSIAVATAERAQAWRKSVQVSQSSQESRRRTLCVEMGRR